MCPKLGVGSRINQGFVSASIVFSSISRKLFIGTLQTTPPNTVSVFEILRNQLNLMFFRGPILINGAHTAFDLLS